MTPTCLIVAAQLCIPHEYVAVTQRSLAYHVTHQADQAAVKRLGIKIEIHVGESDDTKSPANLLNKDCQGETCLYYYKFCGLTLSECTYAYGEVVTEHSGKRALRLQGFSIAYKSWSSLMKAEDRMYLAYGSKEKISYVKLRSLKGSPRQFPPSCSTRDPGCLPEPEKARPVLPRL